MSRYRFRRRESRLEGLPWWYLDILAGEQNMTHLGPEKVLETYEIGEPIQPKFDLPGMKHPFVRIEKFVERDGRGCVMVSIPGDPNHVRLNFGDFEKLPPLVRLAAEAF